MEFKYGDVIYNYENVLFVVESEVPNINRGAKAYSIIDAEVISLGNRFKKRYEDTKDDVILEMNTFNVFSDKANPYKISKFLDWYEDRMYKEYSFITKNFVSRAKDALEDSILKMLFVNKDGEPKPFMKRFTNYIWDGMEKTFQEELKANGKLKNVVDELYKIIKEYSKSYNEYNKRKYNGESMDSDEMKFWKSKEFEEVKETLKDSKLADLMIKESNKNGSLDWD